MGKELATGLALGIAMGLLMFGRGYFQGNTGVSPERLGLTLGLTVLVLSVWAATIAAILPIVLIRLRIDPAVVSAPLITSLLDATGLFIYLSVAGLLIL